MMEGECSSHRSDEDCELSDIQLTWKRVNVGGNLLPRDGHCACSCGGKIFIFGGVVQTSVDGAHRESNDLLMFDPDDETLVKINAAGTVPSPRSAATIAAVNSKLYLFGGLSNDCGWLGDFYVFDIETKTWSKLSTSGTGPSPRDKLASAPVGQNIYYFGGFGPKTTSADEEDDDDDELESDDEVAAVRAQQRAAQFGWFDDLFVFNTATNSWSHPVCLSAGGPTPRAAHTMCSFGQHLVIFGGRDTESRTNDLHIYDTVSRRWVAGPIVNRQLEPRSFHAACAVGCKLVIVGGRGLQDQHFADVHVFDTELKVWQKVKVEGDALIARGAHTLVADDGHLVLYGGSADFRPNVGHCTRYFNDVYVMKTDGLSVISNGHK